MPKTKVDKLKGDDGKALSKLPNATRAFILDLFEKNGFKEVTISFSGEGDDGQIDDLDVHGGVRESLQDLITVPDEVLNELEKWPLSHDGYKINPLVSISDFLEQVSGFWINYCGVDWVNGEGGTGYIRYSVDKKGLKVRMEVSEWERVEGYTQAGDL
jgi:hypothetical protein